jgi:hypothetical protein
MIVGGPKESQGETSQFDLIRLRRIHFIREDGILDKTQSGLATALDFVARAAEMKCAGPVFGNLGRPGNAAIDYASLSFSVDDRREHFSLTLAGLPEWGLCD